MEYFYHRFVLHRELKIDPEGKADPEFNAKVFAEHIHHHVFMNQFDRIPIPLSWYYPDPLL